uniref:Nanos n=1 Tax=Enchytraeus japonensis TaxID=228735 RepID=A0AAT9FG59_9ANNE
MYGQYGWPMSHSPQSDGSSTSPRSSASSGFEDGDVQLHHIGLDTCVEVDDALGLRRLASVFYAPELQAEMERLFCFSETTYVNPTYNHKSVWDDFQNNGQEAQLDDLDKLFRGMTSSLAAIAAEEQNSVGEQSQGSSLAPSPPLDPDQAPEESSLGLGSAAVQDILTKAQLIDILREREQLQRATKTTKRVVVSGGGLVASPCVRATKSAAQKSATGKVCVFCRNNGEPEAVYTSHQLKDPEGNVTCPILYIYTCPICGANGKQSHTIKYCPYNTGDSLTTLTKSSPILTQPSLTLLKSTIMPLI